MCRSTTCTCVFMQYFSMMMHNCDQQSMTMYFCCPQMKFGESNVFTHVCLSVEGVSLPVRGGGVGFCVCLLLPCISKF